MWGSAFLWENDLDVAAISCFFVKDAVSARKAFL
jgi:hypothetical protein